MIDWLVFSALSMHTGISLYFTSPVKLGVIFVLLKKYKTCLSAFTFLTFPNKNPILPFTISLLFTRGTSIKKIRHYEKSLLLKDLKICGFVTPLLPIFI